MADKEVCLLNDSFPPIIDGVANVVQNYAKVLQDNGTPVVVVTPAYPGADDSGFPYPVIRYQSVDVRKQIGYTIGNPFYVPVQKKLVRRNIGLLHSHCPMMSNYMARALREALDVPMVMTYHTKYDIDIANALKSRILQKAAIDAIVENVSACDELWVVSRGAGENIRSLGYEGDYIIMENGVDMPRGRASETEILEACKGYDIPENVPLFLFVGRMMWYKGIRIILDALAALKSVQLDFRMVFVGSGNEAEEIRKTSETLGLSDKVFFTGAVQERKTLTAWYSRADLFLFPSTFDTNGLVVREAAAASLASVLIRGSAAAEGVSENRNALLIEENAASLAACLARIIEHRDTMKKLGENAGNDLYLSWEDAVKKAQDRYEVVKENYRSGHYKRQNSAGDSLFALRNGALDLWDKLKKSISPKN